MPAEIQNTSPTSLETLAGDDDLAILYQEQVEPIIKRQIALKFHVSLRADDDSYKNQDALELLSEVKLLLLQKLDNSNNGGEPIRDIEAYARIITSNVFNQYLRNKYPRRLSLKNQFRYLFEHHPKL